MLTRKIHQLVVTAIMPIWLLLASVAALGQQQASSKNVGTVEARSQGTRNSAAENEEFHGGPKEGIAVHGHWKIVIKNPDGSVASQNEFENELIAGGMKVLASVLTQAQSTAPAWTINFMGQTSGFGASATVQAVSGTIVLTASRQSPFPVQLSIIRVSTSVLGSGFIGSDFTMRDLTQPVPPSTTAPGPITLQAGQTVDATVVLSFS